ncbi:MAG: DUF4197 domain-containing protein [Gammaproteobacteria bacterium]|nr:DUF4197 domain-containing protein [Gammaproteobacteria bacterium]
MKKQLLSLSIIISLSGISSLTLAGWQDMLKDADQLLKSSTGQDSKSIASSSLSNSEITKGLKEALDVGVKKSINMLGTKNGFLSDDSVKILLPDSMQKIDSLLRSAGQEKYLDEFISSMNQAAEQAVPKVSNIFADAITKMSLSDAQAILEGGDTAATDYFKTHTSDDLSKLIKPYVNETMNANQVTQYYKVMTDRVKQYDTFGLMNSYLGNASEIDDYVTNKTMEGLFTKIAEQERLIRENPAARTTDILKSVFK